MTEEGNTTQQTPVVYDGTHEPRRQTPVWLMYLGLALSTLFAVEAPFLSGILFGTVLRTLAESQGSKAFTHAIGISVLCIFIRGFIALPAGFAVLTTTAAAIGIVRLMWAKKADTTHVAALIVAIACISMLIDSAYAAASGTTIPEVMTSYLEQMLSAQAGVVNLDTQIMNQLLIDVYVLLWPLTYMLSAAMSVTYAALGSYFSAFSAGKCAPVRGLPSYDAPLWTVGVLATSILLMAFGTMPSPVSQVLLTVGLTAAMSVRVIFLMQGLGVVSAKLLPRTGCLMRFFIISFAFWLEMMFMIVSIIGLVDIWANFRKLKRSN